MKPYISIACIGTVKHENRRRRQPPTPGEIHMKLKKMLVSFAVEDLSSLGVWMYFELGGVYIAREMDMQCSK